MFPFRNRFLKGLKLITSNANDRLDRLENLLEAMAQRQAEMEKMAESNARAIEALASDRTPSAIEVERLYRLISKVTEQQSKFCDTLAELNDRQAELSHIQKEIIDYIRVLSQKTEK